MSGLPAGWTATSIGEVTTPFESLDPSRTPDTWIDYIDIGSIDNSTQRIADPKRFLGRDAPSRARRRVEKGDVLFSTVRTYLKNIARVPPELDGALTSTGIALLRPSGALEGSYLFRWVCSAPFLEAISKAQDGTMYPAVSDRDVSAAFIALPPLAEQRRIAAKLDALTARTARARADLDRIPALAARYKQAVLAKAFSGELTTGSDGPTAWSALTINSLADVGTGSTPKRGERRYYEGGDIPWVTSSAVNSPVVDNAEQFITQHALAETNCKVFPPGTLLVAMYGEGQTRGRVSRLAIPAATNQALACISLRPGSPIQLDFMMWFLRANYLELRSKAAGGVQPNLNLGIIKNILVPIPSVSEQSLIVHRLDAIFAEIDRLTAEAAAARRGSTRRCWPRPSGANWSLKTPPMSLPASCSTASAPNAPLRRRPGAAGSPPPHEGVYRWARLCRPPAMIYERRDAPAQLDTSNRITVHYMF